MKMSYINRIITILLASLVLVIFTTRTDATPLDDYVHAPDPYFGWEVIQTYQQPDYTLYILNFTSQKWLDGEFFS